MESVSAAGHEHHHTISAEIDQLPALADMLGERPRPEAFDEGFREMYAFVTETLVPHIESIERTLYPELDRLMQSRHSMAQMRREHEDLQGLIKRMGQFGEAIEAGALGPAGSVGLRRILYRLYAVLKVHLAEEEEYMRVLDHNLSAAEQVELVKRLEHAMGEPI